MRLARCVFRRPLGAEVDWELSSLVVSFVSLCRFNARGGGVFCCWWVVYVVGA